MYDKRRLETCQVYSPHYSSEYTQENQNEVEACLRGQIAHAHLETLGRMRTSFRCSVFSVRLQLVGVSYDWPMVFKAIHK